MPKGNWTRPDPEDYHSTLVRIQELELQIAKLQLTIRRFTDLARTHKDAGRLYPTTKKPTT